MKPLPSTKMRSAPQRHLDAWVSNATIKAAQIQLSGAALQIFQSYKTFSLLDFFLVPHPNLPLHPLPLYSVSKILKGILSPLTTDTWQYGMVYCAALSLWTTPFPGLICLPRPVSCREPPGRLHSCKALSSLSARA